MFSQSSPSIFGKWKTDEFKCWGCFSPGQDKGSPAPSHQQRPILFHPVQCHVSLAFLNPQGRSPPWSRLGTGTRRLEHAQTLPLLLGSVCTGSSGFNPVKSSNFPREHLLF